MPQPFIFRSVYASHRFTIRPYDYDHEQRRVVQGKRAEFHHHQLETTDVETIEYLRGHMAYGLEITEPQEQAELDPRDVFGAREETAPQFVCELCGKDDFEREAQLRGHLLSCRKKHAKAS